MFEPDLEDPRINEPFVDPVAAVKRALALKKLQEEKRPGWEGVKPEVDARLPPPPRLPPPTIHMPEDPAARMSGSFPPPSPQVAPGGGAVAGPPSVLPPVAAPPAPPPAAPIQRSSMESELVSAQDADAAENRRRAVRDDILYAFGGPMRSPAESHASVLAQQGRLMARQQDEAAAQAKLLADANSPLSRQLQDRFAALQPEVAKKMGATLRTIPGSAFPGFKDMLPKMETPKSPEEIAKLKAETTNLESEARLHDRMPAAPKANPNEINPEGTKETIAAAYPEELKARPELKTQLAHASTKEEFDAIERTLEGDRQGKRAVTNIYVGGKVQQGTAGVKAEAEAGLPGFEHNPDVRITPEQASKVRDAVAETGSLTKSISHLQELVKAHGIDINPRDPAYPEMQGVLRDIQLQAKGPNMYQLGVLSGPDQALLDQVTGDPTKLKGFFQGSEGLNTRLETMKGQFNQRLNSKLKAHGYSKPAPPPGAVTTVKMRFPSGAVHQLAPEDVEYAKEKKGAVVIDDEQG